MQQHPSPPESQIYKAVFRVLNTHSLLDLNLGLCLSFLKDLPNPKDTYPWIDKLSCAQKIEQLGKLTKDLDAGAEYADWAQRADSIRSLRNRFAHGVWEFYLPTIERPIGLRLPPWISVDSQDRTLKLSIQELEEQVHEVEEFFEAFMKWRAKYKL